MSTARLRRWFYAARAFTERPAARRYRRRFGRESFTAQDIRDMTAWAEAHPESVHRRQRTYHAPTHGTGICPRCGSVIATSGDWVTGDLTRVNCGASVGEDPE